jgi:hypothetical protein
MNVQELCDEYLAAMNAGDLERVLALYEPDAQVVSPLYGTMPAKQFYTELFADTGRSETRCINRFDASSHAPAIALQFHYRWTLADGVVVEFNCVDVFALNAERNRFAGLTIVYDTAPLRAVFDAVHRRRMA